METPPVGRGEEGRQLLGPAALRVRRKGLCSAFSGGVPSQLWLLYCEQNFYFVNYWHSKL